MKVTAIIQARLGSTRLPGKSLKLIQGKTMLDHVIDRVSQATRVDELIIATTTNEKDDLLEESLGQRGLRVFRGSEEDVLDRFYQLACQDELDVMVRITSDCPLIDAGVIDSTIECFESVKSCDYASNTHPRTFPRGLDVEVFSRSSLKRAWQNADKNYQRSHVTPYMYETSGFILSNYSQEMDDSQYRWTVDVQEDLDFIESVYKEFSSKKYFDWQEVLSLLNRKPELMKCNEGVQQKTLHDG